MTSSTSCARAAANSSASVRAAERRGAVEQERADVLARLRPTGLAHLDDLAPEPAQMRGEQPRLRRLARAVGALEGDEAQAVAVRGALFSRHGRSLPRGYTRARRAALLAPRRTAWLLRFGVERSEMDPSANNCHAEGDHCRWNDDSRTAQELECAWRNVSLPCLQPPLTSCTGTATRCDL